MCSSIMKKQYLGFVHTFSHVHGFMHFNMILWISTHLRIGGIAWFYFLHCMLSTYLVHDFCVLALIFSIMRPLSTCFSSEKKKKIICSCPYLRIYDKISEPGYIGHLSLRACLDGGENEGEWRKVE